MSTWESALLKRPPAVQAAVRAATAALEEHSAFSHYVLRNLTCDRFLSQAAADDFIDLLFKYRTAPDLKAFRREYIHVCHAHALCGGEIGLKPYPAKIGRAIEKAQFVAQVVTANGVSRRKIERLLQDLENDTLTPTNAKIIATLLMSRWAVWVTWDRSSNGRDQPFAALRRKSSYDLRNALGLPVNVVAMRKLPMLVFEYNSGHAGTLFRPTTADAAEYLRFCVRSPPPPPDSEWYGLTVPWQDDPYGKSDYDGLYPPKMPEALHGSSVFPPGVRCETYYFGA
jgi:hypothetical protein